MKEWFMVAIGGMIGSLARHGINVSFKRIGVEPTSDGDTSSQSNRMLLDWVGMEIGGTVWLDRWTLGARFSSRCPRGLTTFSTYGLDVVRYAQQHHYGLAAWVAASNLALGLLAVLLGMWVVRPAT